jgi:hypothetical protein
MTQKKQTSGEEKSTPSQRVGKKPYRKPEFRYERAFETLALACGKISPGQFQCRVNRKVS